MEKYLNLKGNSSIIEYAIGENYIDVKYNSVPIIYRYSYLSAGIDNVDKMKELAKKGYGLQTYIDDNCKYQYEMKIYYQ